MGMRGPCNKTYGQLEVGRPTSSVLAMQIKLLQPRAPFQVPYNIKCIEYRQ